MGKIKREIKEFGLLLRSVPASVTALFILSVFAMNLLANKSVATGVDWLALDCGIFVSWISFLSMDILTKRFGPKAATELSLFAILIDLLFCLLFFICSVIPGVWSASYVEGSEGVINSALDGTFGGVWYVVLGSALAFIASAVINNFTNFGIGKLFKKNPNGAGAFYLRSYASTAIGQFADNIIFAFVVSHVFFGWSALQCVTCALTGMVVELAFEVAFSFLGYKTVERWDRLGVGKEYLEYVKNQSGTGGNAAAAADETAEAANGANVGADNGKTEEQA